MSDEIKMGVKDEMEHTSSKKVAKKIAKDHLKKDPKYYTKLKKAGLEEATLGGKNKINPNNGKKPDNGRSQKALEKGDSLSREGSKELTNAVKTADKNSYSTVSKKALHKIGRGHDLMKAAYRTGKVNMKNLSGFTKSAIVDQIKEATLGGAARVGKSNPNNVKSKKSGFTINTKMNDAYSKVPDAKGLVRKRLLQKGKAAWNVGHAKKLAEEENLQELTGKGSLEKIKKHYAKKETLERSKAKNLGKLTSGDGSHKTGSWEKSRIATGKADDAKRNKGRAINLIRKRDKTVKEENLQELTKKTLKSYLRKSNKDADNKAMWTSRFGDGNDARKLDNREKGIKRAKDRVSGTAMVKKKYVMKEGLKKGDYGHEKEKAAKETKTKVWNKADFKKYSDNHLNKDWKKKVVKEEENLQELSTDKLKSYVSKAEKSKETHDKKAKEHAWRANDAGTIKTLSKHIGKRDQAEKKVANRDKGIKTAKDKIWRKKVQAEYDGPNRDGKTANDGVRYTGD